MKKRTRRKGRKVVTCRVTTGMNNTKVVMTWYDKDKGKRVNRVKTVGERGYKNTKRGSFYGAQEMRAKVGEEYQEKWGRGQAPGVHVMRRGMGRVRVQVLNELKKAGRQIMTVSDATKDPHNGCRRKKQRRI